MPKTSSTGNDPTPFEAPAELFSGTDRAPSGWLLVIDGEFGPGDALPSEAIRGAWAVDANGHPTGRFRHNPRFRAQRPG